MIPARGPQTRVGAIIDDADDGAGDGDGDDDDDGDDGESLGPGNPLGTQAATGNPDRRG